MIIDHNLLENYVVLVRGGFFCMCCSERRGFNNTIRLTELEVNILVDKFCNVFFI